MPEDAVAIFGRILATILVAALIAGVFGLGAFLLLRGQP